MSLMAADDKTIYVNTFVDEMGENPNNCSLREAIITAQKNAAYGGCSVGKTGIAQTDHIQLQEGTYLLTRGELAPASSVVIVGKNRNNYTVKSALTSEYPAFEDIKS
ncbi:MAG: CSLREA domain-containing protein, partial [Acinetobacter sp.]